MLPWWLKNRPTAPPACTPTDQSRGAGLATAVWVRGANGSAATVGPPPRIAMSSAHADRDRAGAMVQVTVEIQLECVTQYSESLAFPSSVLSACSACSAFHPDVKETTDVTPVDARAVFER